MTNRMTARTWLAGGAAAAVLLLLVAWFGVISPELAAASDLRTQAQAAQDQNQVLDRKVVSLRADFANIDELTAQLAAQRQALPAGGGLPDFTRQLSQQAGAAGETLTSITTGEPALVTAAAATTTEAAAGSTTEAAASSTSAAQAPVAGVPSTAATPADQLLSVPVTVVVDGSLAGHRALLTAIQQTGPRRALVGSVVLAPADGGAAGAATTGSVDDVTTMTLTLQVFVAPQAPEGAASAPTTSAVAPG